MKITRKIFQAVFLLMVLYLAFGYGQRNFENFCPFGGLEGLYSLVRFKATTCALSPWNFGVFAAVLGLTLVSKKSFCGWVCPIGFIYELLGKIQNKLFKGKELLPAKLDSILRALRWAVMGVVLYFTVETGELIFRGYDPYYLLFSGFGDYSIAGISIPLIVLLLGAGIFIKMAWCRYLCPMSAAMDAFSLPSVVGIRRDDDKCTSCGKCDRACDLALKPSKRDFVTHVDCTNCLECVNVCPEKECMNLALRFGAKRSQQ